MQRSDSGEDRATNARWSMEWDADQGAATAPNAQTDGELLVHIAGADPAAGRQSDKEHGPRGEEEQGAREGQNKGKLLPLLSLVATLLTLLLVLGGVVALVRFLRNPDLAPDEAALAPEIEPGEMNLANAPKFEPRFMMTHGKNLAAATRWEAWLPRPRREGANSDESPAPGSAAENRGVLFEKLTLPLHTVGRYVVDSVAHDAYMQRATAILAHAKSTGQTLAGRDRFSTFFRGSQKPNDLEDKLLTAQREIGGMTRDVSDVLTQAGMIAREGSAAATRVGSTPRAVVSPSPEPESGSSTPLTELAELAEGGHHVKGHRVKLNCVNWSGGHMLRGTVGGLDQKPMHELADDVWALGFNCVRLNQVILFKIWLC